MAHTVFIPGTVIASSWLNDVDTATYTTVPALVTPTGSSTVGFLQAGSGAVATTVQAELRNRVSITSFGVVGDGVTDYTTQINVANATVTAEGKALYWPAGTYIASNIPALAGMKWIGESSKSTIIKLKNSTNAGLVTSASSNIDDVYIQSIRFDGNSANNTSGDTLTIKGCRPSLIDVIVINSAAQGIVTDWNIANGARVTGCEGFFSHITIDSPQTNGWIHNGPSDSHFESVIIIDAGLKTNNTYYGLYLTTGPGNGRFFNCHTWNRDTTTNVATVSCYVQSSGNNFLGCHFEGGTTCVTVAGNVNNFAGSAVYAPRGTYSMQLLGSSNYVGVQLGLNAASANPAYKGILLQGSNNIVEAVNGGNGCTQGAIDFTGDTGQNIVKLTGFQASGTVAFGTPNISDDVKIAVSGTPGQIYSQELQVPWTTYTPVITSGTGTITTSSATGRYRRIGKTTEVEMTITITTNGTGATYVSATLPVTAAAAFYMIAGRENGVSGKAVQGLIGISATGVNIYNYDGTYPAVNGSILLMTGSYESA